MPQEEFPKPEINVYLDDIRAPPNDSRTPEGGWTVVRSVEEFMKIVDNYTIVNASFDHDLGYEKTGYDAICYLEQKVMAGEHPPLKNVTIHTSNPSVRLKMEQAAEKIEVKS